MFVKLDENVTVSPTYWLGLRHFQFVVQIMQNYAVMQISQLLVTRLRVRETCRRYYLSRMGDNIYCANV